MRRARSNILCTDGEYCQKARKNFLKSFIQHGIKDDCKKGLSIALEEVLETKRDYKIMIMLLLALKKYENCYNLIRWLSSSKISEQRVLPCVVHQKLSSDMVRYEEDEGWTPVDKWTEDADVLEDLDWLFGRQESKLARLSLDSKENNPSHLLYIGLPVLIINMALLNKKKSVKDGFWSFVLGTHPRLGENSAVRKITGLTPVIKKIYQYCNHQPDVDNAISVLENHLVEMLKICLIRLIFMDIVDEEKQAMWTMNACTVCREGGDCVRGVIKTTKDAAKEPFENILRREDPHTFSILLYCIEKMFGLDNREDKRNANVLRIKSFVLYYMRKYQAKQPTDIGISN